MELISKYKFQLLAFLSLGALVYAYMQGKLPFSKTDNETEEEVDVAVSGKPAEEIAQGKVPVTAKITVNRKITA